MQVSHDKIAYKLNVTSSSQPSRILLNGATEVLENIDVIILRPNL